MRMLVSAVALAVMPVAAMGVTTANLLTNPGAETGTVSAWTTSGSSTPFVDNGTFNPGILPHSGNFDFVGGGGATSGAQGFLTQNVSLGGISGITQGDINQGNVTLNASAWQQSLDQGTSSDAGQLTLVFRRANNSVIATTSSQEVSSKGTWQQVNLQTTVPAQTRSIDFQLVFNRHAGSDLDAYFDDAALTLTNGSPVTAVPEPAVAGLLLLGLGGMILRRRTER